MVGAGVVYKWKFSEAFSQSTIDGRVHSNACSIISIAVAHNFLTTNIQLPSEENLPSDWINLLRQCMQKGNELYDSATLEHHYLDAKEAADLFNKGSSQKVNVQEPIGYLRIVDVHEQSTLGFHLKEFTEASTRQAALFIYDNKTITFPSCPTDHSILLVDSHLHSTFGAAMILAKPFSHAGFIPCVKEITGMTDSTHGNFSYVKPDDVIN